MREQAEDSLILSVNVKLFMVYNFSTCTAIGEHNFVPVLSSIGA